MQIPSVNEINEVSAVHVSVAAFFTCFALQTIKSMGIFSISILASLLCLAALEETFCKWMLDKLRSVGRVYK